MAPRRRARERLTAAALLAGALGLATAGVALADNRWAPAALAVAGVLLLGAAIPARSQWALTAGIGALGLAWVAGQPSLVATAAYALGLVLLAEMAFAAVGADPRPRPERFAGTARALAGAALAAVAAAAAGGAELASGSWLLVVGVVATVVAILAVVALAPSRR